MDASGVPKARVLAVYGTFARSIPLPRGADEGKVVASYRDGVLEVRVPVVARRPRRHVASRCCDEGLTSGGLRVVRGHGGPHDAERTRRLAARHADVAADEPPRHVDGAVPATSVSSGDPRSRGRRHATTPHPPEQIPSLRRGVAVQRSRRRLAHWSPRSSPRRPVRPRPRRRSRGRRPRSSRRCRSSSR